MELNNAHLKITSYNKNINHFLKFEFPLARANYANDFYRDYAMI